jgi:hypothetical protein
MRMQIKLLLLLLVLAAASTGCSMFRDPRDAPWDPKRGQVLFNQIPAWEGAANRVCGGHLTEAERRATGRSARC